MDRYGLICRSIYEDSDVTQRELSSILGVSLGSVNKLVSDCINDGLIQNRSEHGKYSLTKKGMDYLEQYRVDGAVITAAGFGSRFVPLSFETPKGLLEVFGERMIERQIRQLHEAGITDITLVVGYLKEKFEYLIDKYNVKLFYNPEYTSKGTLATVYQAREFFRGRNMYLLVSDNWIRNNMFHTYECGSWYSAVYMEGNTSEWCLGANKKGKVTSVVVGGQDSWVMYGPAFLSKSFSDSFIPLLEADYNRPGTEQCYWEQVLLNHIDKLDFHMNCQPEDQVYEFENLEELRQFDPKYRNHSDNEAMRLVSQVFQVKESAISNIRCLKSGMTNKSFLFEVNNEHYICRIPGPGTELLINRKEEEASYHAVEPLDITEHIIYFDGENGYKIAKFYEGSRNANAKNWDDIAACMAILRKLHQSNLKVEHRFNLRERIDFYEALCHHHELLLFEDYNEVRGWMNTLLDRVEKFDRPCCLSHIDSVADNFLFLPDGSVRLIDWEYAAMHDPLIDISMCSIYSYYNEEELDRLLELYLERVPSPEERIVTYAYAALGGFLWCLWAVFKSLEGEEFGEYTIVMYHYAKLYYKRISRLFPA
ncbi:phosphotransferase [[Clostridium] symbiosum]|uniref:sugar phosphate nucleotidyltransferase n=1 Tax=Clostridium symbiosum TaxID=1512 RepID=UPI001D06DE44|nr:phosphotransferase [[Clostridium] symbiosum]MCB6607829.1 phosphotransferase [[Clostridium] symbiosum]MCB6930330.1 phosphotransferase [[Clostridium] symbiosum]